MRLVLALGLTAIAAALGAVASIDAAGFYAALARPSWAPPSSVFGPVWTVLYLAMAVAAWLVWRAAGSLVSARVALGLFAVQLVLNALWSWLFFAWHRGFAAFVDIIALWIVLAATIGAFARHSRAAALLMLPYLTWVTFAGALCFAVWRMNPRALG